MMDEEMKVYFENTRGYEDLLLGTTKAYEVLRKYGDEVSRLGWVISAPVGEEKNWVALAVVSWTGDSFLGSRPTAGEAIELLWSQEKMNEEVRRADSTRA
jgi:hypothetical protein